MAGLMAAAEQMGLEPCAMHSNIDHLKRLTGPAVIDFPQGHFCVLLDWSGGQARILDPPRPIGTFSVSELEKYWGKHVVIFSRARPERASSR